MVTMLSADPIAAAPEKSKSTSGKKKKAANKAPMPASEEAVGVVTTSGVWKDEKVSSASIETKDEEKKSNPYMEILSKRLRTLKKRITKIEKYEQDIQEGNRDKLNADQLMAVQKKEEVVQIIRELDEAMKQMQDLDLEEQKLQKKKARADMIERQKAITAAVQEAEVKHGQDLRSALRVLIAINHILPVVPTTIISVAERQALSAFNHHVSGTGFESLTSDVESMIAAAFDRMMKVISKSDEVAFDSVSYETINSLVDTLVALTKEPAPEEPAVEESVSEPVHESPSEHIAVDTESAPPPPFHDAYQPDMPTHFGMDMHHNQGPPAPVLSFMTSSHLEDQSQMPMHPMMESRGGWGDQSLEHAATMEKPLAHPAESELVSAPEPSDTPDQVAPEVNSTAPTDAPTTSEAVQGQDTQPRVGHQQHNRPFRGRGGFRGGRGGFRGYNQEGGFRGGRGGRGMMRGGRGGMRGGGPGKPHGQPTAQQPSA